MAFEPITISVSNKLTGEPYVSLDLVRDRYIEIVWRSNGCNVYRTAKVLRIDRKTVYTHLWRMGLVIKRGEGRVK